MRFARSQPAVFLAAVSFVAASVLGGLLHNHDHGLHDHGLAHGDRTAIFLHPGDLGSQADDAEPQDHESSPAPVSDEDCLACRLAAQSGLVSLPAPEVGLCPLVAELRCAPPIFFVEPVQPCGLARAPPVA